MSGPINDGGPAFPVSHDAETNSAPGMSLRAYIAAQVVCVTAYSEPDEDAANRAVEIADALIKRLEQP